jgi:hypothetical protein
MQLYVIMDITRYIPAGSHIYWQTHFSVAGILDLYHIGDAVLLHIVAGDEVWFPHFEPTGKQQVCNGDTPLHPV